MFALIISAAMATDPTEQVLDEAPPPVTEAPAPPVRPVPSGLYATFQGGVIGGLNHPLVDTYTVTDLFTGEQREVTDILRGIFHDGFKVNIGLVNLRANGVRYGARLAFSLLSEGGSFGNFDVIAAGLDLRPEILLTPFPGKPRLALIVSPVSWHGTGTFASAVRYPGLGAEYAISVLPDQLPPLTEVHIGAFVALENVTATTDSSGPTVNPGWVVQTSLTIGTAVHMPD